MDAAEIARRRLAAQLIVGSTARTPHEVVCRLLALQAQDYTAALWAIGSRLPGATETAIEQAIAARAIVRTWPMRGTLHIVAAEDARWLLELLAPRVIAGAEPRYRQLGLDDATFARARTAIGDTLRGDRQLSRPEVFQLLEDAGISTSGQRGIHICGRLAMEGTICFGARAGKQPSFALLEEWAPNARRLDRATAVAELALRYFTGHGPATLDDLVRWAGLPLTQARAALAAVHDRLACAEVDGRLYYFARDNAPAADADTVQLLAGFDEYLLGYRDRDAVLDPADAARVVPGGNGIFHPIIVAGGRVTGTWKRSLSRRGVALAYALFAPLSPAQEETLPAAAEQYARFLGLPLATRST